MKLSSYILFVLFNVSIAHLAWADDTLTSSPTSGYSRAPAAEQDPKKQGWIPTANIALNLAFTSSEKVVGQTDGNSQTYGLNFKGSFDRISADDEWRNTVSLVEADSKTPNVSAFLKSNDELKLETTYLYAWSKKPEAGPYVRGLASAPLFSGQDAHSSDQVYSITHPDKTSQQVTASTLHLTDGLRPLETKESVGGYIRAVHDDNLNLEFRLGFAANQTQANGQYAIHGSNSAGQVQVDELQSVNQAGVEAAAGLKYKIDDKSGVEAALEMMTPFINNKPAGDSRSAVELTNYDGFIKLTSNITKWAAFAYDYKLKIEPQLVSGAQQIHMLTLNLNYNLF